MTKIKTHQPNIAYFTMEIGLTSTMPTYSGGLGVLAGDTIKSAADAELPLVAITLLHRKGYFHQKIDASGRQVEEPVAWNVEDFMQPLNQEVEVAIEGKVVKVKPWRYDVKGVTGHVVPVYFLDTAISTNDDYHRSLTDSLYGGDDRYRLCQEAVLGFGGVEVLKQLGLVGDRPDDSSVVLHMNEGHAALLTTALLRHWGGDDWKKADAAARNDVRNACVFTTHTPVEAGHDRFDASLVKTVLGSQMERFFAEIGNVCDGDKLNMSRLAMRYSHYINGVAKRHGEVSRKMFPGEQIAAITNGVHAATWIAEPMAALYDRFMSGWRQDNHYLRSACELPLEDLGAARLETKKNLFSKVEQISGVKLDPNRFTIGFARRAAEYKRGDLVFEEVAELKALAKKWGPIQFVFAGKAHPRDEGGKRIIQRIYQALEDLRAHDVVGVYLPNYNMDLGHHICSGVDLWLNNPIKPMEASGTSGMKAAMNGVPNLSTLDGWWVEGCIEGITGWEIDDPADGFAGKATEEERHKAAQSIYTKLDQTILPLYYENQVGFQAVMRNSIFVNGPFFSTQRMVEQYRLNAWRHGTTTA